MKTRILLAAFALFGFASNAQTAATVTMGPGYANQVFYKFSTNTGTPVAAASWDIAFNRTNNFSFATRVNDGKGIQTYEVGPTSVWSSVDVAQVDTWARLYNSDTNWNEGAFDAGSATYGWGEYNVANHHVVGARVFVLKYADGSFKKFKIDDFFGGYTFTYSSWNGTAWSADTTQTIPNATGANHFFNYYNLNTDAIVEVEPETTQWDLLFTQYVTDYPGGVDGKYKVTGVLSHPGVLVAQHDQPSGLPADFSPTYEENVMNVIGFDWKVLNNQTFQYVVNSDTAYFVKLANGTVYRVVFNTFVGSSSGVSTFNFEDVTSQLDTQQFGNKVSFGVYPNPSSNKRINIVYDGTNASDNNTVSIYSLTGAKVFERKLDSNGFANAELNLGNLNSGVYILKFESGEYSSTKKIVLQ